MLKFELIHPEILRVLGQAGEGSRIVIADGNYPARSNLPTGSSLVALNLSPDVVTCSQVLSALVTAVPISTAWVMMPDEGSDAAVAGDPPIWDEFLDILVPVGVKRLTRLAREEFYQSAEDQSHVLTVLTGDSRQYASLMLAIGSRSLAKTSRR